MNLPAVAPDAPPSNVAGRWTSITLFTTQKWWGRCFMPFMFTTSRAVPKALDAMDRLSFISFASWSLIRELPYNGPPQTVRRLRYWESHRRRSGETKPQVVAGVAGLAWRRGCRRR
jgi:hypothetical protein